MKREAYLNQKKILKLGLLKFNKLELLEGDYKYGSHYTETLVLII